MSPLSILLVEDDEIIRLKFKKVCKSLGGFDSIIEAENGSCALSILKNHHFDIIISDLKMPIMDGFSFLKNLKKDENLKKIPVLIMTTSENRQDFEVCNRLGAAAFFKKSLKFTEYEHKVLEILNYWRARKFIYE